MLEAKIILLILVLILNITDGTNSLSCKEIMEIFYQTEDQFYELDCTESQKLESNVTLTYHCRSLQKKMDIFGRKYYDFGVSRNLGMHSKIDFFFSLFRNGLLGQFASKTNKSGPEKVALEDKRSRSRDVNLAKLE